MTVLIATIGVNVAAWVVLVCAARWQGTPDQQRTPDQISAGDSDVAVGTSPISAAGLR